MSKSKSISNVPLEISHLLSDFCFSFGPSFSSYSPGRIKMRHSAHILLYLVSLANEIPQETIQQCFECCCSPFKQVDYPKSKIKTTVSGSLNS